MPHSLSLALCASSAVFPPVLPQSDWIRTERVSEGGRTPPIEVYDGNECNIYLFRFLPSRNVSAAQTLRRWVSLLLLLLCCVVVIVGVILILNILRLTTRPQNDHNTATNQRRAGIEHCDCGTNQNESPQADQQHEAQVLGVPQTKSKSHRGGQTPNRHNGWVFEDSSKQRRRWWWWWRATFGRFGEFGRRRGKWR